MSTLNLEDTNEQPASFEACFEAFMEELMAAAPELNQENQDFTKAVFYRGAGAILELLDGLRPSLNPASMVHSVAAVGTIQQEVFDYLMEIDEDDMILTGVPEGEVDAEADSRQE